METQYQNISDTSMNQVWDIIWRNFKNISLTYDLAFSQNNTKTDQSDESYTFDNPAQLGIFTGLLIAWLADFRIGPIKDVRFIDVKLKTVVTLIFNIMTFIFLSPFVTIFLATCFLYRQIVTWILIKSHGNDFGGLLEGTDCVWALEDHRAYSIINVLAILEPKAGLSTTSDPSKLLNDLRKLVQDRLISQQLEKFCWFREQKYGYFYWRRTNGYVDLEERIRFLDDGHNNCDGTCGNIYNGYLRKKLTETCNKALPNGHKSNWEILVGGNCEKCSNNFQKSLNTPLIFRIHHSVGDGVALLRILLEALADSQFNCNSQFKVPTNMKTKKGRNDSIKYEEIFINGIQSKSVAKIIRYSEDLLDASMPFAVRRVPHAKEKSFKFLGKIREGIARIYERVTRLIKEFGKNLVVMVSIPSCLLSQALLCSDNSSLHGAPLTGEKVISCWMESDFTHDTEDSQLVAKIRDIKEATGTRFGDVILAALSANLHSYFQKIQAATPKSVTVVIPARILAPSKQLTLRNRFSVGLLPLCISEASGKTLTYKGDDGCDSKYGNLLERLRHVSKHSEDLRRKPDYLINYWVMTWLSEALPKKLLRPFLMSHSTMVFSNLPGPNIINILGNSLKKVAFWIPHRGSTGIGWSCLTYGGRAHFSMVVDKAIIKDEKILDEILRGTVNDIQELHEYITRQLMHLRKQGLVCSNA